jgi:glycosyltransferase involved in cell wall biosynthesis
MDERKGLTTLLSAFKTTLETEPNSRLVMIGTGPSKSGLKGIVAEKNMEDSVIFIDWLPNQELPAIFCGSDVFVYPSEPYGGWEEQFGFSMAEASACGLPVISTDTGSINEVVINDKTGILVEPKDPFQLSRAMIRSLADASLRNKMGENGRKYIAENFSNKVIAGKFGDFFEKI